MKKAGKMIHTFLYDLKLKYKLMLSYVIIITLPVILLAGFVYTEVARVLEHQVTYSATKNFDQTITTLGSYLDSFDNITFSISRLDILRNITQKGMGNYTPNEQAEDRTILETSIYAYINRKSFSTVKIYFNDDFTYFTNKTNYFNIKDVKNELWYQIFHRNFMQNRMNILVCPPSYLPENNDRQDKILSYARAVIDQDNYGHSLCIFRMDFPEKDIKNILLQSRSFDGGLIYLQNDEKVPVSSTDYALLNKLDILKVSRYIGSTDDYVSKRMLINGKAYIVYKSTVGKYNLELVSLIPYSAILAQSARIRNITIAMAIVISFFAFTFAFLISAAMSRRISIITETMKNVKSGKLETIGGEIGKDEIGQLIDNYNYMAAEMEKLIDRQYQSIMEIKNSELKLLQAQINPHFLYNTLDMIKWFAYSNMNQGIQKAVIALARFYRLSLSRGKEVISIKNELEHVEAYLQLQNMRYLDKLHYQFDIPDEIMEYTIIKTTLQPIIENAIVHGIMEKPDKEGNIKITARIDSNDIFLTVSDDGVGISEENLSNIRQGNLNSKTDNGYGLVNVDARLRLYYGEGYKLTFSSIVGMGTTVTIRIAAKKE